MIVCGLKLTHDGAVALVEDGRLVFSVEVEKLDNGRRYSQVDDMAVVARILGDFGYHPDDVDEWVIDGWDGRETGSVSVTDDGVPLTLTVAPYRENDTVTDLLAPGHTGEFRLGGATLPFTSYVHVAGHLASAYCTAPFAGEPSFVLIWDGGLFPRLYHVDPVDGVTNGGALFPLIGHTYASAAHHFGPFRRTDEATTVDDLSVAGKLMAYIAMGSPQEGVLAVLRELFHEHFDGGSPQAARYRAEIAGVGSNAEPSLSHVHAFFRDLRARVDAPDVDVLASVHQFLEDLLVERVTAAVRGWYGDGPWNLCFVGGCALNIKWNSALRAQRLFRDVWVPPFPNDSGSAIGAACAHLAARDGLSSLTWHPRSGPALGPALAPAGWRATPCSPKELAGILHRTGDPVVLLDGRAELGPRALGGRSIIAPAVDQSMKDLLNEVKGREHYRPVAPICLTEHAPGIFEPGVPDPHMLFDHHVRDDWKGRIPAVLHLDGTARLQTVCADDDPTLTVVLREYHRLSGIPVLCNTSANHNGRGFFPDVASAAEWGRVGRIWSAGVLFEKGTG
ncbi:MAG: carbamoyltransferase N-terminal domain-containing protein [Actinophytocola sp.]|uniref:carbamoyltransferase N-terminal domain-containing protein n=1 Tax=Actinophytocola sp. TaxID=1872138 RepID=UPI003C72898B